MNCKNLDDYTDCVIVTTSIVLEGDLIAGGRYTCFAMS